MIGPVSSQHALDAVESLSSEELQRFIGWLCSKEPRLVVDTIEEMRGFLQREQRTDTAESGL